VVLRAWTETSNHHEPFHILYNKLLVTEQNLRNWSNGIISDPKMKLHMAEVILRLDVTQENRSLSPAESDLRTKLKRWVLGLADIERARTRQASRVTNIKLGDANTKYFHRWVNARRRKNHIWRLQKEQGWAVSHDEKVTVVQEHFQNIMKRPPQRQADLNWDRLQISPHNLDMLASDLTESKIKDAINQMPSNKARGPDGFTGLFLKNVGLLSKEISWMQPMLSTDCAPPI